MNDTVTPSLAKGKPDTAGAIETALKNPRLWRPAMAVSALIAIGYVIKQHVGWMETADKKRRMLVHQLTFWGSSAVGLTLIHGAFLLKRLPFTKIPVKGGSQLALGALGGSIGALGFPAGRWLSHKLYPSPHQGKEDLGKENAGQAIQQPNVFAAYPFEIENENSQNPTLTPMTLAPLPATAQRLNLSSDPDNPDIISSARLGNSQSQHPVVILSRPQPPLFGI